MYGVDIIDDRIFWIYVIISLFFIIIGLGLIINSKNKDTIAISILWLIAVLALMLNAYYNYAVNEGYFKLFVIVLFISLLIVSVLWAGELWNKSNNQLLIIFSILSLLGGFILLNFNIDNFNSINFWTSLIYLVIWLCLILYII